MMSMTNSNALVIVTVNPYCHVCCSFDKIICFRLKFFGYFVIFPHNHFSLALKISGDFFSIYFFFIFFIELKTNDRKIIRIVHSRSLSFIKSVDHLLSFVVLFHNAFMLLDCIGTVLFIE